MFFLINNFRVYLINFYWILNLIFLNFFLIIYLLVFGVRSNFFITNETFHFVVSEHYTYRHYECLVQEKVISTWHTKAIKSATVLIFEIMSLTTPRSVKYNTFGMFSIYIYILCLSHGIFLFLVLYGIRSI